MGEDGLFKVDVKKCIGCGICEIVCFKNVIEVMLVNLIVKVNCNFKDKGVIVRKFCSVEICLGCGICVKNCIYGVIKIENNFVVVDFKICVEKCKELICLVKCLILVIKIVN